LQIRHGIGQDAGPAKGMSRKAPVGTYAILWLATSKPVFCKMKITTAIPFLAVFRLGVSTETFLTGDLFILSD